MAYNQAQVITILRNLGFRVRTTGEYVQSVKTFQGGYNLGAWLTVDGQVGPITSAALARSELSRKDGKCTASAHFDFKEFACTCKGAFSGCLVILVRRELLSSLETYRLKAGTVRIESGYRCPFRNAAVGGAKASQHMYGTAADLDYILTGEQVANMHVFAGIGKSAISPYKVRHVDRRDVSGHNVGSSTVNRPQVWTYPR